jgi:hypothetical protein
MAMAPRRWEMKMQIIARLYQSEVSEHIMARGTTYIARCSGP